MTDGLAAPLRAITELLDRSAIPYMVVGSFASSPRRAAHVNDLRFARSGEVALSGPPSAQPPGPRRLKQLLRRAGLAPIEALFAEAARGDLAAWIAELERALA